MLLGVDPAVAHRRGREPFDAPSGQTVVRIVSCAVSASVSMVLMLSGCTGTSKSSDSVLLPSHAQESRTSHSEQPAPSPGAPSSQVELVPSRTHGSLTDRQFSVAYRSARHEAKLRTTLSIDSATAKVVRGRVLDSNTGHRCTFGTLLKIKVIGVFTYNYTGTPGGDQGPVHAVLITADPESGNTCLFGVQPGHITPDAGSTVLFTGQSIVY